MDSHIILLPHPGPERLPRQGTNRMEWPSCGPHARKYLRAIGEWKLSTGASGSGWLEFWAEYEGPTFCEELPPNTVPPRVVHIIDPKPGTPTMNTDPWIFHRGFVWSVCRHSSIRPEIQQGDIVLFGSTLGGYWVLDTVLVIDRRINGMRGQIGGVYDHLVFPTVECPFRPFIGKPFWNNFHIPFSFVPAKPADNGHQPFPRPSMNRLLSMLEKISDRNQPSPNNAQALVFCRAVDGLESFWGELISEVESAGLVLGTVFQHPSSPEHLSDDTNMTTTTQCIQSNSCRTNKCSRTSV